MPVYLPPRASNFNDGAPVDLGSLVERDYRMAILFVAPVANTTQLAFRQAYMPREVKELESTV